MGILIRPGHLFEGHHVGRIAARTYYDTELTKYLSPRRAEFYSDYEYGFQTRAQARMFSPRQVTYFAYEKSKSEDPIGKEGRTGKIDGMHRVWYYSSSSRG